MHQHELELGKIMEKIDHEDLAISLQKFEIAKSKIEWLGPKINSSGITPLVTKTEAIMKLDSS